MTQGWNPQATPSGAFGPQSAAAAGGGGGTFVSQGAHAPSLAPRPSPGVFAPNVGVFGAAPPSLGAFTSFAEPVEVAVAKARKEAEEKAIREIIKEDCNARGSHIADELNVRDADGRVMVNFNHPEDEAPIYLTDHIAKFIKPHQIGGT